MLRVVVSLSCALGVLGCPRPPERATPDAGLRVSVELDAGPTVTAERLEAWLHWQRGLATISAGDAGLRARAKLELALLADAGLSVDQADAIEAVVAAVVAERNVAKLTGADALQQFQGALAELAPEQKAKAEAALNELKAKAPQGSLGPVEAQFGVDAVRVVLSREAEVTRAWDALLEARGERR